MRTAEIEINGKKYLLCFNLWALIECLERYGGLTEMFDAISEGSPAKTAKESLWLLETLVKAGAMHAEDNGLENPEPITADKMLRNCGADFFVNLKANLMNAVNKGMSTNVEVESSKNVETTQAE